MYPELSTERREYKSIILYFILKYCLNSNNSLQVEERRLKEQREEESGSVGEAKITNILPGDGDDAGMERHLQYIGRSERVVMR